MQRVVRFLSWTELQVAVNWLVHRLEGMGLRGVYGPPRGGLVLAVCLSHRLGVPLLSGPRADALWVDDIVDSGRTLRMTAGPSLVRAAWYSRVATEELVAAKVCKGNEWLCFPWEDRERVAREVGAYGRLAGR